MRVIRLGDLSHRPWKNGGGVTTEYLVAPEGAGLDDFDWRVSRAEVAADGPFSVFPGIDRTLTVTDGTGIDLVFADRTVRLDPSSPSFAFPGDVAVEGRLIAGTIHDLNVMSRRGRFRHRVERLALPATIEPAEEGFARLVVALGPMTAHSAAVTAELMAGDMIVIGTEAIDVAGRPGLAAIEIEIGAESSPSS